MALLLSGVALCSLSVYSSEIKDQTQGRTDYGFWFDSSTIHWQEFMPTLNNLMAVEIYLNVTGNPGNVIVEIRKLDGSVLGQKTVLQADITPLAWNKIIFPAVIELTPGTKYRIYVRADQVSPGPSESYIWRGSLNSPYNPSCDNDTTPTKPTYDFAFRTYGLNCLNRNIAYIYSTELTTANSYKSLLDGLGYPTTLVYQGDISSGTFDGYSLIIAGPDTGVTGTWGDAGKVAAIKNSYKPVLGLEEGGASLFSELGLFIEWLQTWGGTSSGVFVYSPSHVVFNLPHHMLDSTLTLYSTSPMLAVWVPSKPADVVLLGRQTDDLEHFPIIEEKNRYLLWGFGAAPSSLSQSGQDLFENIVAYMIGTRDYAACTLDSQGVYYRDSYTGTWAKMGTPAIELALGDISRGGKDDLLGVWTSGTWVKYTSSGTWAKLGTPALDIAAGDMDGDGREDLLGSWAGQGVFYRNSETGAWVKMASPATRVAAGDLNGDGIDDLIGVWADGTWVKYSTAGNWSRVATPAVDIAAGDMEGDGRENLLGTWTGQGVYYRDSGGTAWVKIANPATKVAAGDLDRDQVADLIGVWGDGTWVKHSSIGAWAKINVPARDVSAGNLKGGIGIAAKGDFIKLLSPSGGYAAGPEGLSKFIDLSSRGPGGVNFIFKTGKNLFPRDSARAPQIAGPGDPGFRFVRQKNLTPREALVKTPARNKIKDRG